MNGKSFSLGIWDLEFGIYKACPGGGTGRHAGLKIL